MSPTGELFVMREGKLAILKPKPFHVSGGRVAFDERDSGLASDDRVVVSQLSNPRDGMEITEAVK